MRYEVKHKVDCDHIFVYVHDNETGKPVFDFNPFPCVHVHEPDFIERLRKVTYEDKIKNAIKRMQRIADTYNSDWEATKLRHRTVQHIYNNLFANSEDR